VFTPDPGVRRELGLKPGEMFSILRFVSWQASHDIGEQGLDAGRKRDLVERLGRHGRVFISSEVPLSPDLEPYRFPLPVDRLHHALAHAALLVGESAPMAAAAAVLGVPAVYISDLGRGYTDELDETYHLVFRYPNARAAEALDTAERTLADPARADTFAARRARMLAENVDVTSWMIDYVDGVAGTRPA